MVEWLETVEERASTSSLQDGMNWALCPATSEHRHGVPLMPLPTRHVPLQTRDYMMMVIWLNCEQGASGAARAELTAQ